MQKANESRSAPPDEGTSRLLQQYGYSERAGEGAPAQCAATLSELAGILRAQQRSGRGFFVGSTMTAADIYWACFSNLLRPWPVWAFAPAVASHAIKGTDAEPTDDEKVLLEHRDRMFREHLRPIDF